MEEGDPIEFLQTIEPIINAQNMGLEGWDF